MWFSRYRVAPLKYRPRRQGTYMPFFFQISLKYNSGHLNIDPKQYAKYQDPSSSGSPDILQ